MAATTMYVPSHCALSLSTTSASNSRKGVKYFSRIQNLLSIYVIANTLEKPCHFTIRINNPELQKGADFLHL